MSFVGDFFRSFINILRNAPAVAPAPAALVPVVPPVIAAIPAPALVPAAKMLLFLSLNLIEETISLICIVFLMSYLLVCDLSKNNSFSIVKASKF